MRGKERFLLWLLAGIIASQIVFLAWGAHYCALNGGLEACPELGRRWENTYGVAIATVLALLTGSALTSQSSSGDRDPALASSLPGPPQLQRPECSLESEGKALDKPAQASGKQVEASNQKSFPPLS